MTSEPKSPRKIVRTKKVMERVGKSRVQIWRDVRANKFPAPVSLGPNSIGWYEDEVERWLETRPRRTYGAAAEAGYAMNQGTRRPRSAVGRGRHDRSPRSH